LPIETSIVSMTEITGRYIIMEVKEFNKQMIENYAEVPPPLSWLRHVRPIIALSGAQLYKIYEAL
jgi:hypothetical protein